MTIRIALALLTIIVGCVFIMRLFVWHSVDLLYQARKQEVQHIVQVAWKSLTPILEKQRAGVLSPGEALEEATAMLRGMTYVDDKGDNYIFMSRYDGTMLVQPFEPRLQGTNQWDLKDSRGTYLVRTLVATAQGHGGKGFTEYYYRPPGRDVEQRKISYVIGIPEWQAYMGTGLYTEDADAFLRQSQKLTIIGTVVLSLLMIIFCVILLQPVLQCYGMLQNLFGKIRNSPEEKPPVDFDRFRKGSGEWTLLKGFSSMLDELFRRREQLRRSDERFDLVLRATADGIWDWDRKSGDTYYSPRWMAKLGFPEQDFEGDIDFFLSLLHPDDLPKVRTSLEDHVQDMASHWSQQFRLRHQNGTHLWVVSRALILRDEAGRAVRMVGAYTDITESLMSRKKLEAQRDELAHLSRVATMGEMTATIAHEMNQPLTAIGGNAYAVLNYLADDEPDKTQLTEILEDIVSDTKRASEVIRQLRALVSKREEPAESFDINQLVGDTLGVMGGFLSERKTRLVCEPEERSGKLSGRRVQIQQVLINLLMNAVEQLPSDGCGEVRIRVRRLDCARFEIQVIDNGSGIPAAHSDIIFTPFFSSKPNGMGMGLAISRTIIEAHGGTITAENAPQGGAVFRVVLPGKEEEKA